MLKKFFASNKKTVINKHCVFIIFFIANLFTLNGLPQLQLTEKSHDFGRIKEEMGPFEYSFTFTNTGDQDLIIEKVKPS